METPYACPCPHRNNRHQSPKSKEWPRRALAYEAEKNQVSLNAEMARRLDASLEAGEKLELTALRNSMEAAWARFEQRHLALELEQTILSALERRDYETARTYAIALRRAQETAARQRATKMADGSSSS